MLKVVPFLAMLFLMAYATTPSVFTQVNEKYFVSKSTATFLGAYLSCRSFGFKMVTITSEEDFVRLNSSLKSLPHYYWLGGAYTDPQVFEPKWTWIETGEEVTYTNWAPTEPFKFTGDACLEAMEHGLWTAQPCNNKYYYICEM